jgi:membrane protein DedA with SNARE-associated domain
MTWFDYCVVRVKDLCDIMDKMGLTKKMDILLRLYVNTGSITTTIAGSAVTAGNYYYTTQSGSTFSNVCPMTINFLGSALPTGTTQLVGGVYVARSPATTIATVSVPSYTSAMLGCQAYYSICEIESNKASI